MPPTRNQVMLRGRPTVQEADYSPLYSPRDNAVNDPHGNRPYIRRVTQTVRARREILEWDVVFNALVPFPWYVTSLFSISGYI